MKYTYMDKLVRGIGYPTYVIYLRSPHWKDLCARLKKGSCFVCSSEESLRLHHITYARVGAELDSDLVTVCEGCHERIHDRVRAGLQLPTAHLTCKKEWKKGQPLPAKTAKIKKKLRVPKTKEQRKAVKEECLTIFGELKKISDRDKSEADVLFNGLENLLERKCLHELRFRLERAEVRYGSARSY